MNLEVKKTFDCNQGAIRAVRYNVDGNYCLTCGSDRKIKLFNPKTGKIHFLHDFLFIYILTIFCIYISLY